MGGPYKLKKRGKPMTTIYDAAILLVDDNPDLLTLVTDNLRTAGYKSVCTAADCAAARAAFAAHRPDLMILDINLPDGDGFGLFRTLRTESDVPALFLSARDADADRLFGLGLGADDYLTKPFLMQELLLRVQHLLQRAYRTELRRSRVLTLGDCTVNLQDAAVRRADGTTLALTATERALLQRLADDRGHIVTYDAVCEAVWGADYYGYENSLNVHIRHLREKIEPDPGHPQWLLTVRGAAGGGGLSGAALRRGRGQPRPHRYAGRGPDPYSRRLAAGPRPHARGLAAGLRLGDGAGRRRQCDLAA